MRIYVGNIAKDVDTTQLTELFAPYGKTSSVEIALRGEGGPSRGFGFVEMADQSEAKAAMAALNGKALNGQELKVNEARPKGTTYQPLTPIH